TSTNISPGGKIADAQVYNSFGCKGGNVSPELSWSSATSRSKSFAILMHDPDAPTGSGWWHWVVYNIPASVSSLPAGAGDPKKSLLPSRSEERRVGKECRAGRSREHETKQTKNIYWGN